MKWVTSSFIEQRWFSCRRSDRHDRRRQLATTNGQATFEIERQLALSQTHLAALAAWPQGCEMTPFKSLHVDAKACAIPQQHLRPVSWPIDEKETVTTERVPLKVVSYKMVQPIVALSEVGRGRVRPHSDSAGAADHDKHAMAAKPSSVVSPSSFQPDGATNVTPDEPLPDSTASWPTWTKAGPSSFEVDHALSSAALNPMVVSRFPRLRFNECNLRVSSAAAAVWLIPRAHSASKISTASLLRRFGKRSPGRRRR